MSTLIERFRAQAQVDYEEVLLHYRLRQVLILGDLPEPYYRDWDEYVPQSQEALAVKAIVQELGSRIQRHHIVPRCVWKPIRGVDMDSPENIVWVSAAEHLDLHKILIGCYRGMPEEARMRGIVELGRQLRDKTSAVSAAKRLRSTPKKRARLDSKIKSQRGGTGHPRGTGGSAVRRRTTELIACELDREIERVA